METLNTLLAQSGFVNRILRCHQEEGVCWLSNCYRQQNGSILADEMGLGKTTQSVAFLALNAHKTKQSLIIAPLSVINNWLSEFTSFLPDIVVLKYYGDPDSRVALQDEKCDILITTYEMFLKDNEFFCSKQWHVVIVDEGHRLKNPEGMTNTLLREVDCRFRLILSGTPVQNNIKELYTLLSFIDDQAFPLYDIEDFCERYENEKYSSELHELLRPFLLRRTKNQVLTKLPPSQECIVYCQLTQLQKKVYKGCLVKDASVIDLAVNRTFLNNTIMHLRKCSNHPYMFNGIEPEPFSMGMHLIEASGKLKTLDKILTYCKTNQHRVLIFSQFTLALDILQDYAHFRDFSYERLDGSVRDQERFNSINNFSENDVFCFLLSTRAGGVGLNLTAADTVIFYDTDWNPQNDIQAAARAHRLGQTKPVQIIRLVSKHTVDEYMLNRMEAKLKLTKRVIVEGSFSSLDTAAEDTKTLSDMLMFGLSNLLDEQDKDEVDIDLVLGKTTPSGEWLFDNEVGDEKQTIITEIEDFYDFEGKNYREKKVKDRAAFDVIVKASVKEIDKDETDPVENSTGRVRKKVCMTVKDLQEKENQLNEERKNALERQRAAREAKKLKKWDEAGYISTALPFATLLSNMTSNSLAIEYIVGDVTQPAQDGIILHCTDSSGEWGSGGLFTALSKRSKSPENSYELAKGMGDLRHGQCHLCSYLGNVSVALLICIKRGTTGVKLDLKSLEEALTALSCYAKSHSLTIHMPRIGFSTSDWYGAERLLRKCLISQNIKTSVYYYSQRSQTPRARPVANSSVPGPGSSQAGSSRLVPNPKRSSSPPKHPGPFKRPKHTLPTSLTDMVIYLDPALKPSEQDVMTRYIIAANGELQPYLDNNVTHVLSYNSGFEVENCNVQIVSPSSLAVLL